MKERGWENLEPADLAKSISIEAAELLELFQWDHPSVEETKKDCRRMKKIQGELADVIIYCIELGVTLKLDVGEVVQKKLALVRRKYPARLMRKREIGNRKYWAIKKKHRIQTRPPKMKP